MADLAPGELDYFEGIENDSNQVRTVFISNACHICKVMRNNDEKESSVRLSSCSGCRLIAYCGAQHQKEHWSEHKDLCKVIQKLLKKEGKKSLFAGLDKQKIDSSQWKTIRYNYMVMVEGALQRQMKPYEREMFLYPRVCATCYNDDGPKLHECERCQSAFYCSDQHLPKRHKEWCNDLRSLLNLNVEQSKRGYIPCPLPSRLITEYEDLPESIREFLVTRMLGPMAAMSLGKEALTLLTELASYPLTVLWGIQQAAQSALANGMKAPQDLKSLVIHVVGAEIPFECNNLYKWDVFLLNVLPNLRELFISFIGPELIGVPAGTWDEELRCPYCFQLNKQFVCDFQPNTFYHDYVKGSSYIRPDVIVAFNSGLYRQTGYDGGDSWGQTVPYLLQEGVPLILTAYTAAEAPMDLKRLEEISVQPVDVLVPPTRNPYRSSRPCRNFVSEEESPLMFKNQFITVVRRSQTRVTSK